MTDKPVKQTVFLCLGMLTLGLIIAIAFNSMGYVPKCGIVAPEDGYTAIQREQLEKLLK